MNADERTTAVLLDEYDSSVRLIVEDQVKRGVAQQMRRQAGSAFAAGDDAAANALRDFAVRLESTLLSEQSYGANIETAHLIYDIVRERHEHDND